MDNLDLIKSNPEIQMELSELLFKALWPEKCWHESHWTIEEKRVRWECTNCWETGFNDGMFLKDNPNLFSDWTGFGILIETINKKLRDEFEDKEDYEDFLEGSCLVTFHREIALQHIKPVLFAYLLLEWLNPKGLREVLDAKNKTAQSK